MVALYDQVLLQLQRFDGAACTGDLLASMLPPAASRIERDRLRSTIWTALKELQKDGLVDAGPLRSREEGRSWFIVDWDDEDET
jgi:hypothetical protein